MAIPLDHTNLHRGAKYFMDSGKAESHEEAMAFLGRYGLTVLVGADVKGSLSHQTALLTLINVARRTLLGGVEVVGVEDAFCLSPLAPGMSLAAAVASYGGAVASEPRRDWPFALIGAAAPVAPSEPCWRVTWEGWRGGVIPVRHGEPLAEDDSMALAPVAAAALCASEAFTYHAKDHALAGRRASGISLWRPGADWRAAAPNEPSSMRLLPAHLWLIGLGNLGQAFAWLIASLPYTQRGAVKLVLQDFDRIAVSNESTSLLSFERDVGQRKARVVGAWLDARGFDTFAVERAFGAGSVRSPHEPNVALCGVDNVLARRELDDADFDLVVECGLGGGPEGFRSFAMHSFPGASRAHDIWPDHSRATGQRVEDQPAYAALKRDGMDQCGLAQLAARTVGAPFVGLAAAALALSELLRRLHGGDAFDVIAGSLVAMGDIEAVCAPAAPLFPGAYSEPMQASRRAEKGPLNTRSVAPNSRLG